MFSPELMRFLIKYQSKEFLPEQKAEKAEKNDETTYGFHRFTKYATVPVKVER